VKAASRAIAAAILMSSSMSELERLKTEESAEVDRNVLGYTKAWALGKPAAEPPLEVAGEAPPAAPPRPELEPEPRSAREAPSALEPPLVAMEPPPALVEPPPFDGRRALEEPPPELPDPEEPPGPEPLWELPTSVDPIRACSPDPGPP
jgi:hypothetical protein